MTYTRKEFTNRLLMLAGAGALSPLRAAMKCDRQVCTAHPHVGGDQRDAPLGESEAERKQLLLVQRLRGVEFQEGGAVLPANRLVMNETQLYVWEEFKGSRGAYYMQIENALLKGCRIDSIGMQAHSFWGRNMKEVARRAKVQYVGNQASNDLEVAV